MNESGFLPVCFFPGDSGVAGSPGLKGDAGLKGEPGDPGDAGQTEGLYQEYFYYYYYYFTCSCSQLRSEMKLQLKRAETPSDWKHANFVVVTVKIEAVASET